ncbi:hypothetical protein [Burkholderia cenocepacia]|uniref:hypothetical protein n=1 Tax=Burkholderia cenocepacia TaxID=95486 RepID=UPI000F56C2D0|nr:hypothetical protein [Burkholderia cenocepacia]RQU97808.1 hypothetical protein DF042_27210 [Burkholderia cenocepacia]
MIAKARSEHARDSWLAKRLLQAAAAERLARDARSRGEMSSEHDATLRELEQVAGWCLDQRVMLDHEAVQQARIRRYALHSTTAVAGAAVDVVRDGPGTR